MWQFPRATLSTKVVTVSMYVTLVVSSCMIQVVDMVATADPTIISDVLVSGEASMGAGWMNSSSARLQPP